MSDARAQPVLKREIGLFDATALGIGAIIGSGIFIVTGIVTGIALRERSRRSSRLAIHSG